MPTYFPQIEGVTTQLPYRTELHFETLKSDIPTGQRYAFARRAAPLGRFVVRFDAIEEANRLILAAFFDQMKGPLGEFSFLDPAGNLVPFSEDFGDASWSSSVTHGATGQSDPFGGTRASAITGPGLLQADLIPSDAYAFVLSGSIYVQPAGANTITTQLLHAASAPFATNVEEVPAGLWTRAIVGGVVPDNTAIKLRLTFGPGVWSIFGAHACALPYPGAYAKTPGRHALRAKCRFESEAFDQRLEQFNQTRIELPIVEYA